MRQCHFQLFDLVRHFWTRDFLHPQYLFNVLLHRVRHKPPNPNPNPKIMGFLSMSTCRTISNCQECPSRPRRSLTILPWHSRRETNWTVEFSNTSRNIPRKKKFQLLLNHRNKIVISHMTLNKLWEWLRARLQMDCRSCQSRHLLR